MIELSISQCTSNDDPILRKHTTATAADALGVSLPLSTLDRGAWEQQQSYRTWNSGTVINHPEMLRKLHRLLSFCLSPRSRVSPLRFVTSHYHTILQTALVGYRRTKSSANMAVTL